MADDAVLFALLEELQVAYERYDHEPVFTVAEAQDIASHLPGQACKCLLLAAKSALFLVLVPDLLRVDLKALSALLGAGRLHFASKEALKEHLGLEPGSVSPLGLVHDAGHQVVLVLEESLLEQRILVHPNRNTATLSLACRDLLRLVEHLGNAVRCLAVPGSLEPALATSR